MLKALIATHGREAARADLGALVECRRGSGAVRAREDVLSGESHLPTHVRRRYPRGLRPRQPRCVATRSVDGNDGSGWRPFSAAGLVRVVLRVAGPWGHVDHP